MRPNQDTRNRDQYKRQLQLLEAYLKGRVRALGKIAEERPAEADACNMAQGELTDILENVLPEMRRVMA